MVHEHTDKAFDADIDGMRSAVTTMGGLVERQLRRAADALRRNDLKLVAEVLADEQVVNRLRNELNNELVARMAAEPGSVTAAMDLVFVVQSLERIGDHAKNIAEYVVNVVEGFDPRHAHAGGNPAA